MGSGSHSPGESSSSDDSGYFDTAPSLSGSLGDTLGRESTLNSATGDAGEDSDSELDRLGSPTTRWQTTVEECEDEDDVPDDPTGPGRWSSSSDESSDESSDGFLPEDAYFSDDSAEDDMPDLRPASPDSDTSYDDTLDDDTFDIGDDDPLYVSLDELHVGDNDPLEPKPQPGELPRAFYEHPLVRRAYVQAFIAVAFHGATHDLAQYMLECSRSQLVSFSLQTGFEIDGLERMAVTLRTAERRLGLDPDDHITYYAVCDVCWDTHHPSTLDELPPDGKCVQEDCPGILFENKVFSDGKARRIPVKVLSATSPKDSIRRLVCRPGKLKELSEWRRGQKDEPGAKPPIDAEHWAGILDEEYRMYDMSDGWGWDAIQAGLARRKGGPWDIEDVDVDEVNQRFVTLPNGIVMIFNLDWYVCGTLINFPGSSSPDLGSVRSREVTTPLVQSTSLSATIPARSGSYVRRRSFLRQYLAPMSLLWSSSTTSWTSLSLTL